MQLNTRDPRLFDQSSAELASAMLIEAGGVRREAEIACWEARKRLEEGDMLGGHLLHVIRHIVDGTEDPPVPNEHGHLRRVLVSH